MKTQQNAHLISLFKTENQQKCHPPGRMGNGTTSKRMHSNKFSYHCQPSSTVRQFGTHKLVIHIGFRRSHMGISPEQRDGTDK